MSQLSSLRKKAWKVFSMWVRQNGKDFQERNSCYTCYRSFHWKELNAGHYRHDSHDFDEKNVKPQCVGCNLSDKGRADEFYLHLVRDYGQEVADEIRKRAKFNKYSLNELQQVIDKYSRVT